MQIRRRCVRLQASRRQQKCKPGHTLRVAAPDPEPAGDADEPDQLRADLRAAQHDLGRAQVAETAAREELAAADQRVQELATEIRILRGELQFQTSFCHTLKESVQRVKDLSARWRPRPGGVAIHYADELDAALRGVP